MRHHDPIYLPIPSSPRRPRLERRHSVRLSQSRQPRCSQYKLDPGTSLAKFLQHANLDTRSAPNDRSHQDACDAGQQKCGGQHAHSSSLGSVCLSFRSCRTFRRRRCQRRSDSRRRRCNVCGIQAPSPHCHRKALHDEFTNCRTEKFNVRLVQDVRNTAHHETSGHATHVTRGTARR